MPDGRKDSGTIRVYWQSMKNTQQFYQNREVYVVSLLLSGIVPVGTAGKEILAVIWTDAGQNGRFGGPTFAGHKGFN